MVCQLGLDRIVLSKAWMLPRDYLLLVEELTISSDVSLPDALNDDGTRELATDDDGQGTRPGGDQRRHSAFIRCNN